jgi:large subunit ribosomal protein L4
MKLPLYSLTEAASTITVPTAVFGGEVNVDLISQAVHVFRSNQRQGGAVAQTRSDVDRTTAKWFKQKGTGRARHGARSAPQFVGGGAAHGPTGEENWKRTMPPKMARKALLSALAASVSAKAIGVAADLENVTGKTKEVQSFLQQIRQKPSEKVLVVIDAGRTALIKSLRNVERVTVTRAQRLHTFEVMNADRVIIMQPALTVLSDRLAGKAEK